MKRLRGLNLRAGQTLHAPTRGNRVSHGLHSGEGKVPHLDQGPKKPPEFATTETIMSALMPRM